MLNSASIKRTTVWDPTELSATRPLILRVGADAYYYSFHQIKNVTELFDSAGALAATYDYSPFGELVSSTGTIANPITFSSEVQDSTLGLQYYNYRHLNVLDGRWVNRDPIEDVSFFAQKNLEFHHYIKLSLSHTKGEMLYCGNQTLFNSDLLGLFCSEPKCRKRDIQHTYYFEIKIPMSDFAVNLSAAYRLQESECSIECGNCRCGVKTSKKETYSGAMGGTFTIRIPGSLIRIGEVAFDVGATGYKEENFNSCTGVRTQYDELGFFANVSGGPCIFISSVAKWCVKCNISCSWQANAWSGRSSSECNGGCYFETCVFGICSVIPLGKNDRR